MYAKNGDRKIPPGIVIPENYGGNTFSQPQPPEVLPPSRACNVCGAPEEDANAMPEPTDDISMPPSVTPPCDEPKPPRPPVPPHPPCGGFMDISIGTEELLLIGVMALVFFGGEARDNELLICLLLVLLL